ncbi:MAG: hypothetical protein MUF45_12465 [Spirosomaceae bacterium]|nr:hypothetical protein [Spirosomataceae bacterium]
MLSSKSVEPFAKGILPIENAGRENLLLKVVQSALVKIPEVVALALAKAFCLLLKVVQSTLVKIPEVVAFALAKAFCLLLKVVQSVLERNPFVELLACARLIWGVVEPFVTDKGGVAVTLVTVPFPLPEPTNDQAVPFQTYSPEIPSV